MERSRTTPALAAATALTRSLAEHDADVYGGYLRDLRQELLEPPEFVRCDEPPQIGAGRDRAIRDGVAVWFD
jgi:hypothetical protein